MTLLANKIAEVVDEALAQSKTVTWRGILSTQEWKIIAHYIDNDEINIKAVRRDDSTGAPE